MSADSPKDVETKTSRAAKPARVSVRGYILDHPPVFWVVALMTILVLDVPFEFIFRLVRLIHIPMTPPAFPDFPIINNSLLIIHISAALPAAVFGPFLFSARLREWRPAVHRWLGNAYMYGALIAAVTVVPLALSDQEGMVARIGFTMMATVWLITIWFGYTAVRNRDYVSHRRWMMRSYGLTFAFVHEHLTYRLFLPYDQFTVQGNATFTSMIGWMSDLLLIEIYLLMTTYTGRFVGWKKIRRNLMRYAPEDRLYFDWPARKVSA